MTLCLEDMSEEEVNYCTIVYKNSPVLQWDCNWKAACDALSH